MRAGYASVATYPPDVKYVDRFRAAEQYARENNLGLWGACAVGGPPPQSMPANGNCDPCYPDICLPVGAADYDCAGGWGNGPNYIQGPVRVVCHPDPHGLDRNGDGWGCE